jgi:plasmid stabilization system protein ParE
MKRYEVVFSPEAEEDLADLYRYIEENATSQIAGEVSSSDSVLAMSRRQIDRNRAVRFL